MMFVTFLVATAGMIYWVTNSVTFTLGFVIFSLLAIIVVISAIVLSDRLYIRWTLLGTKPRTNSRYRTWMLPASAIASFLFFVLSMAYGNQFISALIYEHGPSSVYFLAFLAPLSIITTYAVLSLLYSVIRMKMEERVSIFDFILFFAMVVVLSSITMVFWIYKIWGIKIIEYGIAMLQIILVLGFSGIVYISIMEYSDTKREFENASEKAEQAIRHPVELWLQHMD